MEKKAEQTEVIANELITSAQTHEQQINELKELTNSLLQTVQAIQIQNSRSAKIDETVSDLKATARALLISPNSITNYAKPEKNGCCGDDSCGCVGETCCCFEIILDKVRGIQPQGILEVADSGDAGPFINELEVRLFASIDNIGVLIPSLSTTMGIRVPGIAGGGGPGLWMPLNIVIGRVYVNKGTSKTITVDFQGSEIDEGAERPIGLKDEHGAASGTITLDCCLSRIYPPMPTDLYFDQGGKGGGNPGAISLAFSARKVCCYPPLHFVRVHYFKLEIKACFSKQIFL